MGRLLNASDICTRALRLIGKFPTSESAPEGEDLQEALNWLDMILEEVNGTTYVASFLLQNFKVPLIPGVGAYVLSFSEATIQFPELVFLSDAQGNRTAIHLVDRDTFETIQHPTTVGPPTYAIIDRLPVPTLRVWPIVPVGTNQSYTFELVAQAAPPDVTPKGVANATPTSADHGFRASWQRFLIYRLAKDIGAGPVSTLPKQRLDGFDREAERAYARLMAFDDERDLEPPIAQAYEPGMTAWDTLPTFRDYTRKGY